MTLPTIYYIVISKHIYQHLAQKIMPVHFYMHRKERVSFLSVHQTAHFVLYSNKVMHENQAAEWSTTISACVWVEMTPMKRKGEEEARINDQEYEWQSFNRFVVHLIHIISGGRLRVFTATAAAKNRKWEIEQHPGAILFPRCWWCSSLSECLCMCGGQLNDQQKPTMFFLPATTTAGVHQKRTTT